MAIQMRICRIAALGCVLSLPPAMALAAPPTVAQALKFKPIQKDVDCDQPSADESAKCTIKPEKSGGKTGWVVRSGDGQILRNFADVNGDNVVDQWSYFKDGVEVYRDVDANHNSKPDQYRWLNTAGTRWGLDKNEDRTIDAWKTISAEEVSAELVAALRDKDRGRFERLLLTAAELKALGLGPAKLEELQKRITAAPAAFDAYMKSQAIVTPQSKWVYFGGNRPSTVPAGSDESTADVTVYENVAAMVDTDGKSGQVPVGTLVKVDDGWRMIDAPGEGAAGLAPIQQVAGGEHTPAPGQPSQQAQKLLGELENLDKEIGTGTATAQQNDRRADILEELAGQAKGEDRDQWIRQLADVSSAAVQNSAWTDGLTRLKALQGKLEAAGEKELAAYVLFRTMTAEYNRALSDPNVDYAKVQTKWLEDLEGFVKAHPDSPDSAEAMLQLGIAEELSGDEPNAIKWFSRVVSTFPKTAAAAKSEGAVRRLNCVGKPIAIKGKSLGGKAVDLAQLKGRVVLIHYWSSDIDVCKADLPQLEKMISKYDGLSVIGVSLDNSREMLQNFCTNEQISWPQIWEDGGLTNRLANEMGILTVPTMILVDQKGQVVNRNVSALSLDAELKTMLKPRVAKRLTQ